MVRSYLTKNWLEKGIDWSCPTPYSDQSTKCTKSNLCPKNQKHSLTHPKRKILLMPGHHPPRTPRRCRFNQSTWRIPSLWESLQQTKIPKVAKENSMGPCNWTTTKCPEITGRKTTQTSPRQDQGNRKIYHRTLIKGHNQGGKRTICSQLLLRKESRW